MRAGRRFALIGLGYVLAVAGGCAAVALNEARLSADVAEHSGGMAAFGDAVLFLGVTGFLALAPSWFVLTFLAGRAPRALLTGELVLAATGPLSWLAVLSMAVAGPGAHGPPQPYQQLLGPVVAFIAIPRIVVGPALLVLEAVSFFLVRGRTARALLVAAMLMDVIPLGLFAVHMLTPGRA
jgi:hypothetical protein